MALAAITFAGPVSAAQESAAQLFINKLMINDRDAAFAMIKTDMDVSVRAGTTSRAITPEQLKQSLLNCPFYSVTDRALEEQEAPNQPSYEVSWKCGKGIVSARVKASAQGLVLSEVRYIGGLPSPAAPIQMRK